MIQHLFRKLNRALSVVALLSLAACGGGGAGSSLTGTTTTPTTPTTPTQTYKIALSTNNPNVNAGGTATLTAKVTDASSGTAIDGVTVSFTFGSNLSGAGPLSASSATTAAGLASVIYTAGNQSGTDTIIATVTDPNGKTVQSSASIAVTSSDATACKNLAYSGTGATVLSSFTNISGPTTFTMSYKGSGNFIVNLKDATGNNVALLANEIGDVVNRQQSVTLDATKTYFIAVEEGLGQWTIAVNNPSCTSTPNTVGFVQTLTSTGQVDTNSSAGTDVTVIVKSPTNVLMPNVPVTLSASDGNITPPAGGFVTAANGAVTAKLDTQGLFKNGTITLNASSGGVSAIPASVQVTGTTLTINGPTTGTAGNNLNYNVLLQDSNKKPIANQMLIITSTKGLVTLESTGMTDTTGLVKFNLAATETTTLTAQSTDLKAESNPFVVTVAQVALSFTQPAADFPDPNAVLNINQAHTFSVKVTNNGAAAQNQTVSLTTTRGILSSNTATTDANGIALVSLSSSTAGPAVVTATYSGVSASRLVAFTAPSATKVIVQAEPTTVAPNNSSTITTKLLDANNNVVVGKTVAFTTNDTSGGTLSNATAVTDEQGVATITFTAGNGTSADFQITANDQADGVSGSVTMNVASRSAFIVIGTDNTITKVKPNYQKTYSIIVTDINGKPIPNQPLDIKLYSTGYGLGYWYEKTGITGWTSVVNYSCPTNDTNQNGILDAGESTVQNQQGQFVLAPGNVATFSPANPVTNADGIVNITITYPETYANWVSVNLSATTTVLGTANTSVLNFVLPVLADDVLLASGPAGNPSPFGNGVPLGTTENGVQGDGTSCSVIR